MIKKFFQNIDKAATAGEAFTEGTLMLSIIVISLIVGWAVIWAILEAFGFFGLLTFTVAVVLCRILYAGIFAK